MEKIQWLVWGAPGQAHLEGPVVPAGEVWKIRACGIATDDGAQIEWMMQIRMPAPFGWLMPLHRNVGYAMGTPTLAVEREFVMLPGENLAARANGLRADKKMCLLYVGWKFPESDLEKLVFTSGGTITVPPIQIPPVNVTIPAMSLTGEIKPK